MSRNSYSSDEISHVRTQGRTIHWASRYDVLVFLLTLGQASILRSRTADLVRVTPGEAVLDIGCGTGDLTIQICRRAGTKGTIVGIDAAPEMVAYAQKKAAHQNMAIEFRVEPVEALTFADQTFDVVVCSMVFHHLPETLKRQGLVEIQRVLKPGGRFILVDFLRSSHRIPLHGTLKTGLQDLPALLQEVGFLQVERKQDPFPLIGALQGRTADHPV
jgi:ubiquinone/menaquinone biosynthesis C-methylase UbiE